MFVVDNTQLPVACSLTEAELQERRRSVLQRVQRIVSEVQETEHGYI